MYSIRIKQLREREGIAQRRLAELLQIKYSTYCDYENENKIMPLKHLNKLAKKFNASLDYLFGFTNILNYQKSRRDINKILFGIRLKEFRKENKLTQEKLTQILNIGKGTISGYENNIFFIQTHTLYDICKKYNISADYLLGKIDTPKYLNSPKK